MVVQQVRNTITQLSMTSDDLMKDAKEEFLEVESVQNASSPRELLKALDQLWKDILAGKVRPGTSFERAENYTLAADMHHRLKRGIEMHLTDASV